MGRPTVCVDLDGVLADYSKGWQGEGVIGDPVPGAVDFLRRLFEFADVVIHTTRVSPGPPPDRTEYLNAHPEIRTEEELVEALARPVHAWLAKHGFTYARLHTGRGKPIASAYVDDRAVTCRPQSPFVPQLEDGLEQVWRESLWHVQNLCGEK